MHKGETEEERFLSRQKTCHTVCQNTREIDRGQRRRFSQEDRKDVQDEFVSYPTQRITSVRKDGLWGCIDMSGNVVIPFKHMYELEISSDGTRNRPPYLQGRRPVFLYRSIFESSDVSASVQTVLQG